jgi:tetratricopeptide (TPR) repeat protein
MRLLVLLLFVTKFSFAQNAPDRIAGALQDRALAEFAGHLRTDERIRFYEELVRTKPEDLHSQVLLASAFIQKMRETTDFSYIDRAAKILGQVLASDGNNYEALRLRTEIELERHNFQQAAEFSKQLTKISPEDPWNWGTLGDALIEMGNYDQGADAYQKMVNLRPDLSSYNRAAHYKFLTNHLDSAIQIMQRAIEAGSRSPENVAWCWVELGNYYWKGGQAAQAEQAFTAALRAFPNYHPAYAGLGKAQASQGKTAAAIDSYRKAQAITPFPDYAAALYDLYMQTGRKAGAEQQMALIDTIDTLSKANGEKVNRNLALIYSDHDRKLERALQLAQAELEVRRDIYTYDALAWALYKNGRLSEAAKAMEQATKLSTPEPSFRMHAEKIHEALASTQTAAPVPTEASK